MPTVEQFDRAIDAAREKLVHPNHIANHAEVLDLLRELGDPDYALVTLVNVLAELVAISQPEALMEPDDPDSQPVFEAVLQATVASVVESSVEFREVYRQEGLYDA